MKAAVLHAYGEVPRFEEVADPVPGEGEELVTVTAAPLNNIDRARADGSHYSVSPADVASLPAVPGIIAAGLLPDGRRIIFGSRTGTMAQYAPARLDLTYPIPDSLDDGVAAAAWNPGLSAWLLLGWRARPEPSSTVLVLGATGPEPAAWPCRPPAGSGPAGSWPPAVTRNRWPRCRPWERTR